jgi:hypothetical protein
MGLELAWEPSRESDVVGYNVYRSITSGSDYEKINQSLLIDTTCQDTGLSSGIWYYYCVTAVDTGGLESDYSEEVSGIPISLDQGILVVDETRNGTGAPGSPNDAQVDSFYGAILSGYDFTEWDVDSLGKPSIYDLGLYSPIIWHGDDYASQELSSVIPDIERYLDEGGRLWLCGWRPIIAVTGSGTYPFTFGEGDFPYDYLKLQNANESTSSDFSSAGGLLEYPGISVDSTKVPLSWGGRMKYIDVFAPLDSKDGVKASAFYRTGVHQLADAKNSYGVKALAFYKNDLLAYPEVIYTFNSASGDTAFQGKPCGIRYLGEDYKVVFFGFPLYFMKEDEATLVAHKVLSDLEVGIEETTPIPKVSALNQNYPNPFREKTVISYQITDQRHKTTDNRQKEGSVVCGLRSSVSLKIYDISGRLVKTLIDECQSPGRYTVRWDGRDDSGNRLSAGIYFVKFNSDGFTSTRKIVILR